MSGQSLDPHALVSGLLAPAKPEGDKCGKCGAPLAKRARKKLCPQCRVILKQEEESELEQFAKLLIKEVEKRCSRKQRDFDIDAIWVVSRFFHHDKLCALCGLEMTHTKDAQFADEACLFANFPNNVSIDRRDSTAGYTRDNCQLVHVRCNLMKMDMSNAEFIDRCPRIAYYHQFRKSLARCGAD